MVEWSVAAFRACHAVGSIVVACPPGHAQDYSEGDHDGVRGADLVVVEGGATRSHSVSNALAAVETELVAIHDAARPLVTPELIDGVVTTLLADPKANGAIAAAPVTDTIKRALPSSGPRPTSDPYSGQDAGLAIMETIDRGSLWAAQTPQVFRVEALHRALETYPAGAPPATDEAMLVEAAGGRVLIQPSLAENLKVTTPLDLKLAELLLSRR